MPLDEREQRILEEIERRLYEEDPKLAKTVATATLGRSTKTKRRLAVLGIVVGAVVMLGSFTRWAIVAGLGFALMAASAGWIAMHLRAERFGGDGPGPAESGWLVRFRDRWRRDR